MIHQGRPPPPAGDKAPRSIFPAASAKGSERLYFQMIDRAFLKAEPDRFVTNSKPAHAAYLLHAFLSTAKRSVHVRLGGRLPRSFDGMDEQVLSYADPTIIQAALTFLNQDGAQMEFALGTSDGAEGHPLIQAAAAAGLSSRVLIHQADAASAPHFPYDYIVMDGKAVRVEGWTGGRGGAYACFGRNDLAKDLMSLFRLLLRAARADPAQAKSSPSP